MAEAEDKGKRVIEETFVEMEEVAEKGKRRVESVVSEGGAAAPERIEKSSSFSVEIPSTEPGGATAAPKSIPTTVTDYVDPQPVPFWDPSELSRWSFWRAGIAEFIASFLFLYIGVQTIIGSNVNGTNGVGTLGIAFAFGITIFVLVYAIAGISGGHINPAITFAFLLVRRVSFFRFLLYAIAQVLGALCGVGLVKAFQRGYFQRYTGGANFVHYGYSKGAGFTAEMVGTFFLVYVVFTATDAKRKARDAHTPILAPLAIGLTVFLVHLATIPITGTGINPARSFAPAIYWDHHDHAWHDHWIFWVAPLLGATIAAMYHQYAIRAIPFRALNWRVILQDMGLSRPAV
ncbi:unnamed protein product [Calypogeia fissa]